MRGIFAFTSSSFPLTTQHRHDLSFFKARLAAKFLFFQGTTPYHTKSSSFLLLEQFYFVFGGIIQCNGAFTKFVIGLCMIVLLTILS